MAKPLQVQLLEAYEARRQRDGLTFEELTRLSGLACSVDSVTRKLRGEQSLRAPEIEALAKALRVEVTTGKPRKAAA